MLKLKGPLFIGLISFSFACIASEKDVCDPVQISGLFGTPITVEGRAKEEIDSFAMRLNGLNLEIVVKAIKDHAESRSEICYELGKLESKSQQLLATWRSFADSRLCYSDAKVESLAEKVNGFILSTDFALEQLSGYCLPYKAGRMSDKKSYVPFGKDSQFFALFDETILGIVEFQNWAWYELNGETRAKRGKDPEWLQLVKPAPAKKNIKD